MPAGGSDQALAACVLSQCNGVAVGVGLAVGLGADDWVCDDVLVLVGIAVMVMVGVREDGLVNERDGDVDAVSVSVITGVVVCDCEGVLVHVWGELSVGVEVGVDDGVGVQVGVSEGFAVTVADAVGVGVAVTVTD